MISFLFFLPGIISRLWQWKLAPRRAAVGEAILETTHRLKYSRMSEENPRHIRREFSPVGGPLDFSLNRFG